MEPLATASLWSVSRLLDGLQGRLQVRPRGQRDGVKLVERQHPLLELERTGDVELVHRSPIVQQQSAA